MTSKKKSRSKPVPDENPGLLRQMGQGLDKVLSRLNERGQKTPASPLDEAIMSGDFLAIWPRVEEILSPQDSENAWSQNILSLILSFSGLTWAFLTEMLPGDPTHFVILAHQPQQPKLALRHPIDSGLAGWVHVKLDALALPTLTGAEKVASIFHPGDPLKNATSFYGWPLISNQTLRGSLLLAGSDGKTLAAEQLSFLDCLALRLAAHLHQDRLTSRVVELSRLDPQTGLPHRSYFIERLERLVNLFGVQGQSVTLTLLSVSGLGRFAAAHNQEDARSLLRSLAQQLLQHSGPDWELGHVSYGLFALAAPASERQTLEKTLLLFQKRLSDWPIPTRSGRVSFVYHQAQVAFPEDGTKAELLLEAALTSLSAVG
ncbi:MAG: GGDEF domain-containing protein [Deltaproteobacteria bacterium]|jgi:GGDEF domain-containing protein|nr:GGDEF domain-containing protein [Deltaproteobacteria bacterium]